MKFMEDFKNRMHVKNRFAFQSRVKNLFFNNLKLVNAFLNTRHSLETKKKGQRWDAATIYHKKVISLIYKELF